LSALTGASERKAHGIGDLVVGPPAVDRSEDEVQQLGQLDCLPV